MNIFFSSQSPKDAAINLRFYAKTRNKMILESVQLLFNACRTLGMVVPYKPFNPRHECVLWLLQDYSNFQWLCNHLFALHEDYKEQYGKEYKSYVVFKNWYCQHDISEGFFKLPFEDMTNPFLAFSDGNEDLEEKYGHYIPNPSDKKKPYAVANSLEDAVLAYQEYLRRKPYAQGMTLTFI